MKIIGISGRKQAGKNTVANYINGTILKNRNMIHDFFIDDNGHLIINTDDSNGRSGFGTFDITRKDPAFIEYADINLWPYIKVYHFADPLKELAINLFNFKPENVYGNDSQKNEKTNLLWENMPGNINGKSGQMTHREFLEYFGTSIVRKIKFDVWSEFTIKKILTEQSEIAIIPDVRFPNEVSAIKSAGGKVIRLTRNIHDSKVEAETSLDKENYDWSNFDLVINNDNININALCDILAEHSAYWS